ncbi:MAG TPA: alpha/beta hydrolase [Kofleriaceae bacterium]|nr:alpha/beta hydrolase [Kofleriaceae bacterium]
MEQQARTVDGDSLSYRVWGRAGATPLMTVHGLVSSTHHWLDFNPYYAAHRQVISWEYRGHGGNPAPHNARAISIAQFADDAYQVWRAAGSEQPVVVVGLSFGVQVALELYRRHPDCVRALILICGTAGHPLDRVSESASLRRNLTALLRTLSSQRIVSTPLLGFLRTRLGTRIAREITYLSGGANRDSCPPAMLQGLFKHVGSLDPELIGAVMAAYLEHDAHDVLHTITVPTLIVAGDRDQLTPLAVAERMRDTIPGSELVVFPGHSHLVQVEKPREVHAAIDAFLAKHQL